MLAPKCPTYNGRLTFANPRYLKKAQYEKPRLYEIPYDTSDPANRFAPDKEENMTLDNESRSKLNKDYVKPYDYTKQNSIYEIFKAPSLEYLYQLERGKESLNRIALRIGKQADITSNVLKPGMYRIATTTTQNKKPQLPHASRNTISRVLNLSGVKPLLVYLNDVNARTKKPNVVPISASKPKRKMNKFVTTPHKKIVVSITTIQKSKSYHKELYENTNQEWKWWISKRCQSGYKWIQKPLRTKMIWMPKIRKEDVSTSISPTIDIVSRITNVLKISNSLGSNLSNAPSSSNSLADCTIHPIHC
ncbi:hypothetical protein Tco_0379206 [Tanacetum coccineum]